MLNLPSMECNQFKHFSPCICNILFFGVISNILSFVICKRQTPTENLCIVNEDHPRCNVPRKAIKACPGRGQGPLSHLESGHAIPFPPQGFCSPCEFVCCSHSTGTPPAGVHVTQAHSITSVGTLASMHGVPTPWTFSDTSPGNFSLGEKEG